jgi:hypothetical protein
MRWPRAADKKRSTSPSSTVVAVSTSSYRDCLARPRLDEALNLGLVVVGLHAGPDERVQSARGQIEFVRARRATWTFMFMADSRSRVLPGASPCLRKVTIPHCSTPRSCTLAPGCLASPSPQRARLHLQERDGVVLPEPTL